MILRRSKDAPRPPIPRVRHPPACCGARAGTSPEFETSFGRQTDERVLAGHGNRYRNALSVDSDGLPRTRRDRVPEQLSDRTGADGQLDGLERATDSCALGSGGRIGHVPIGRICVRLELRDAGLIARLVSADSAARSITALRGRRCQRVSVFAHIGGSSSRDTTASLTLCRNFLLPVWRLSHESVLTLSLIARISH